MRVDYLSGAGRTKQNFLIEWVLRGADQHLLRVWLRGGGELGGEVSSAPPFFQILRAIPKSGNEQLPVRQALTKCAAELLSLQPDCNLQVLGASAEEILYNLLYLCAGLRNPSILAKPLAEMYQRRQLKGSWNGVSFKKALRDALIENQENRTALKPLWINLLEGRSDFIDGSIFDGFKGLVNATDLPGEPNFSNVKEALRRAAASLEDGKGKRRATFKQWSGYIHTTFAFRGLSDKDWIRLAAGDLPRRSDQQRKDDLPRWAAESLPRFRDIPDHGPVVVWAPILTSVPFEYEVLDSICAGAAVMLDPSPEARLRIREVEPVFEESRKGFTFESPRAQFCMLNEIYVQLEVKCPLIADARRILLAEALETTTASEEQFNEVSRQLADYLRKRFEDATTPQERVAAAQGTVRVMKEPLENVLNNPSLVYQLAT